MVKVLLKLIWVPTIVFVVLGLVTAIINPDKPSNAVPTRTPEAIEVIETAVPVPTVTPKPINPVEVAIRDVCGDRLLNVTGDIKNLSIDCKMLEGFTEGDTAQTAVFQLQKLTQAIMSIGQTESLQFRLIGDFKDKYGNPSQGVAFGFRVPRSLYVKINWQNMLYTDFGKLLEAGEDGSAVTIHPAWQKDWLDWMAGK